MNAGRFARARNYRRVGLVLGVAVLPWTSSCGSVGPDAASAATVAVAFHEALAGSDGAAACALLAPETAAEVETTTERAFKLGLYSRSLGIVMGLIFAASWFAQSIAGHAAADEQRLNQLQDPASYLSYLFSAEFWNRTLQNWQSEFLAVGSMVVLSIYLRQRGSPESKPVGSPHSATGIEG